MIRPEQIPDEVVEAAARAVYEDWRVRSKMFDETLPWDDVEEDEQWNSRCDARAAIVAAINAWPGVDFRPTFGPSRITLPLTQEGDV